MSSYKLIWKGETIGSFSVDDIREMLKSGKIGLMYQIELPSGEIVFLKDFFDENSLEMNVNMGINADSSCENKKSISQKNDSFVYLLYGLCGASFISAYIWIAALALAGAFYCQGKSKLALWTALLSTIMMGFGIVFFKYLYPVISN